ncbi:MAG TPA: hypothetical protein P5555_20420 [Candidatus Paceibacterota bacterium]|nr:hypothetical protein [Verrucomicrobiota bacterium]HOX04581.1 hypothetical protein [Verrucomicrobiota bacterium]HRZ47547.1 hypothetical protein [Candidatus Paceibacterota bacterium]HRZ92287.1 hypothetical protein [Candidatus Paceibacterota bacterium]
MAPGSPILAVLAPDLLGRAFSDAVCGRVVYLWRDGRLRPVVSRSLIAGYLRLWHGLGLSATDRRRWGWWLTAADRAHFVPEDRPPPDSTRLLCERLALESGARHIIHGGSSAVSSDEPVSGPEPFRWRLAAEFLESLASMGQALNGRQAPPAGGPARAG